MNTPSILGTLVILFNCSNVKMSFEEFTLFCMNRNFEELFTVWADSEFCDDYKICVYGSAGNETLTIAEHQQTVCVYSKEGGYPIAILKTLEDASKYTNLPEHQIREVLSGFRLDMDGVRFTDTPVDMS